MKTLTIATAFDIICPWCLIGKRQLDLALTEFSRRYPDITIQREWHGVQLLADLPSAGVPFRIFYERRLGSASAVAARQEQVRSIAASLGQEIHFDKIRTMPNTARAHSLLAYAGTQADVAAYEALLERLFAAYFVTGEDIGDADTLSVIAEDWALDAESVRALLITPASPATAPYGMGNAGVPHFVFNGRYQVTGAQPADALLALMEAATQIQTDAEAA